MMGTFKVFMTGIDMVVKPVEIGVFDAVSAESAKNKALVEFGMHEERFLNIDNFLPIVEAQTLKRFRKVI